MATAVAFVLLAGVIFSEAVTMDGDEPEVLPFLPSDAVVVVAVTVFVSTKSMIATCFLSTL